MPKPVYCGDAERISGTNASATCWQILSIVSTVGGYGADVVGARAACKVGLVEAHLLTIANETASLAKRPLQQRTPLMHAAHIGSVDRVKQYLHAGGAADQLDRRGFSALTYAIAAGHPAAAQLLLERGGQPPVSSMIIAIKRGLIDLVTSMLNRGANVNAIDATTNYTPLIAAILADDERMVRLIVQNGANIEAISRRPYSTPCDWECVHNCTALQLAASLGSVNIIRVLIQSGADINVATWRRPHEVVMEAVTGFQVRRAGDTIFTYLNIRRSISDFCSDFRLLLDAGAVGVVSSRTASWAAYCGDLELTRVVVGKLLAAAAGPGQSHPEAQYCEALVAACTLGHIHAIRTLINAVNADVWVRASHVVFNAFCSCSFASSPPVAVLEAAKFMLERGAVVDIRALIETCGNQRAGAAIIQLILQHRPDLDVNASVPADLFGRYWNVSPRAALTLLDAAFRAGNWDAATELLSRGAVPSQFTLFDLFHASRRHYETWPDSSIGIRLKQRMVEVLALLVDTHGADVHARTADGVTVLQLACESANSDIAARLLAGGAKAHRKDVFTAMSRLRGEAFAALVSSADMDADTVVDFSELWAYSARSFKESRKWYQAVSADGDRHAFTLTELLCGLALDNEIAEDTAALLIPGAAQVTPDLFLLMVEAGCLKVVEAMLKKTVSADTLNSVTMTLLTRALTDGSQAPITGPKRVLHLLVKHGAQIADPKQLLHFACTSGNIDLVQVILERFDAAEQFWPIASPVGSPEQPQIDDFGAVLVNSTVEALHFDVALVLVEAGCSVTHDALLYACKHREFELVRALLRHGASPNAEDATIATSNARVGTPLEIVCEASPTAEVEAASPASPRGLASHAAVGDDAAELSTVAHVQPANLHCSLALFLASRSLNLFVSASRAMLRRLRSWNGFSPRVACRRRCSTSVALTITCDGVVQVAALGERTRRLRSNHQRWKCPRARQLSTFFPALLSQIGRVIRATLR